MSPEQNNIDSTVQLRSPMSRSRSPTPNDGESIRSPTPSGGENIRSPSLVAQQQMENVAPAHHPVKVEALHSKVPQVCEKLFQLGQNGYNTGFLLFNYVKDHIMITATL